MHFAKYYESFEECAVWFGKSEDKLRRQ